MGRPAGDFRKPEYGLLCFVQTVFSLGF